METFEISQTELLNNTAAYLPNNLENRSWSLTINEMYDLTLDKYVYLLSKEYWHIMGYLG